MSAEGSIKIRSYQDLLVWQRAMDLIEETYKLAAKLPSSETYGLASQMRRAAVSIAANIAEGHGRHHLGDYLNHLGIANGSLKELETHFLIAARLRQVTAKDIVPGMKLAEEVGRMLAGLMQKLRARRG